MLSPYMCIHLYCDVSFQAFTQCICMCVHTYAYLLMYSALICFHMFLVGWVGFVPHSLIVAPSQSQIEVLSIKENVMGGWVGEGANLRHIEVLVAVLAQALCDPTFSPIYIIIVSAGHTPDMN